MTTTEREAILEEIVRQLYSWCLELDPAHSESSDTITEYLIGADQAATTALHDVALKVCPPPEAHVKAAV